MCIFSYTIKSLFEKLVGNKSLNTKLCPARLYSRIIPLISPSDQICPFLLIILCCPRHVWTVKLPLNLGGKPWKWGENPTQQPKKPSKNPQLYLPTRKISLNKFTSSPIKSIVTSPPNSNFHVIILYKFHL